MGMLLLWGGRNAPSTDDWNNTVNSPRTGNAYGSAYSNDPGTEEAGNPV